MHPRWSIVTDSTGTGVRGNDPSSLTNAFARLPSALATTTSSTTRLPAWILAHIGSMPILITGFPGALPLTPIRPLIVPVLACAAPTPYQSVVKVRRCTEGGDAPGWQ